MRRLISIIVVASIALGSGTARAQDTTKRISRREVRTGSNNEAQGASLDVNMDADRVTARLNVAGQGPDPSTGTRSSRPTRPKTCLYEPNEKAIQVFGITMLTFSQLRDVYEVGDSVDFTCVYSDVPYYESYSGVYTLGEPPPDALEAGPARVALDRWLSLGFPSPQVTSKPNLGNQRIAIDTWFAVPTLATPVLERVDGISLKAVPRPQVDFAVPVGRWGTERFSCTTPGTGLDGTPNGLCAHAFNHATDGITLASVTIVFDVYVSAEAVDTADMFVDSVTRTSQIPMQVKEIQAVGR